MPNLTPLQQAIWESQSNYYDCIITAYIVIALLWLMVYVLEAKWSVEDNFSNFILFCVAGWYAFRMYHLHYVVAKPSDDLTVQYNFYGTLAAALGTFYKNKKYFKHVLKWMFK